MKLSKRLELVASFVPEGSRIADIGTDHGYIPIFLTEKGICQSALAMDVREGPLSRAREHIREKNLEDRRRTERTSARRGGYGGDCRNGRSAGDTYS